VIADALDAPRNYLSKTLGQLARQELITAVRGPNGGFRLERAAASVTLAEVVEPFGDPGGARMCLEGGRRCEAGSPCRAHTRWAAVRRAARAPLEQTTIADLLAEPTRADLPGTAA
jgi:Rrf2 family protein